MSCELQGIQLAAMMYPCTCTYQGVVRVCCLAVHAGVLSRQSSLLAVGARHQVTGRQRHVRFVLEHGAAVCDAAVSCGLMTAQVSGTAEV